MPIPLTDGRLQFMPKEEVPESVRGYIRDKNNPRIFNPIQPPCTHAIERPCKGCGDIVINKRECQLKNEIHYLDCYNCTERKAP